MNRWRVAAVSLMVLATVSLGCSEDGPALIPTPSVRLSTLTEEGFGTLLTLKEVADAVDVEGITRAAVRDLRREAESVFAAQVVAIESSYSGEFAAEDGGRTMSLAVTDFDTAAAARDQFQQASATSPEAEAIEPAIGDASVELEVNASGVGSIVLFVRGDKLVAMQTSKPEGEDPLVDLDELVTLARLVESRLR